MAAVARIKTIFEEAGALAKISSIHVNGWFGQYDKLSMTRRFGHDIAGLDIDGDANDQVVFVGDSPNDAPLFGFFRQACGVSSVRRFAGHLEAEPAYVTQGGGDGFVEVARRMLAARARD